MTRGASEAVVRPSWLGLAPFLWTIALLALFAQVVAYAAHAAAVLPYPFDLDQGEAYDVNAGWLIAQGRSIYTDNEQFPHYSSNYPPLYAAVVAVGIGLWGPNLPIGRSVSLAAVAGLGALIFLAARRHGAGAGLIAAGCFFLSPYVFHTTALARVNSLTALLGLAGVIAAERGWRPASAILLVAALFTKPTAVDAAAAVVVALWLTRPREGLVFGVAVGLGTLALGLIFELGSGGAFSLNVLRGNVNPFIPAQLWEYFANFGLLHSVPLALTAAALGRAARARRLEPVQLYFLTGLAMAIGVGKWGAGESYFLSAIVASSILAGREAAKLIDRSGPTASVAAVLLIGQCLVSAHGAVSARFPVLTDRGLQASALAADPTYSDLEHGYSIVTRLQHQDGPALLEDAGFTLAAGQQIVGNPTQLRNLEQAGLWRSDRLVADLRTRRYHTVVLDAELYPETVLSAIGRYYFLFDSTVVYRAEQKVFVPGAS